MHFDEHLERVLSPYKGNILNKTGLDEKVKVTFLPSGSSLYSKVLMFFTTSPHLFLAAQVDDDFRHMIRPYTRLVPEIIVGDVCAFAKNLPMDEEWQLQFAIGACKELYTIISEDFIPIEWEEQPMNLGGKTVMVKKSDSPFNLLDDDVAIEEFFMS